MISDQDALDQVITALEQIISQAIVAGSPLWPTVAERLARLHTIVQSSAVVTTAPQSLPVCRYLAQCLTDPDAVASLAAALSSLLPHSTWVQNANYTGGVLPPHFLENYGYAEFVGTRGLIPSTELAIGLLLLGPHTQYPPHAHPAEEIYLPVSGVAEWWRSDRPWQMQLPGAIIYHPSGVAHAMRTQATPVALLYFWWGDVAEAARLTETT